MFKGIQGVLNKAAFKSHQALGDPSVLPLHKAHEILAGERQQDILTKLPGLTHLDGEQFETHCATLIDRFAEFVQLIPETQNSYYAKSGGMLMHGLERACIAAAMAKNYFLPKEDVLGDSLNQAQILWIYSVFSAGLLHDIGKISVDVSVTLYDRHAQRPWNPYGGSMLGQGLGYKYEYSALNQDLFRRRATLVLARQLMPEHSFLWLASDPDVLASWFGMLEDDERSGGTLGTIITRADAEAIEGYFDQHRKENAKQLARLAENLLNERATAGLLGKTSKDKTGALILGAEVGQDFVNWLKETVQNGDITTNQADGKVTRVTEGLFVNDTTIRDYVAARTGQDTATISRGKVAAVTQSIETTKMLVANQDIQAGAETQTQQTKQQQQMKQTTHHYLNSNAANTTKAIVTGIILNNVATQMVFGGQKLPPQVQQDFVKVPAAAVVSATTMAQLTGQAEMTAEAAPSEAPSPTASSS